jgi:hypothetical protein
MWDGDGAAEESLVFAVYGLRFTVCGFQFPIGLHSKSIFSLSGPLNGEAHI